MTEVPPSQTATAEAPAPGVTPEVVTTSLEPSATSDSAAAPQPGATPFLPSQTSGPAAAPTPAPPSLATVPTEGVEPQNALTKKFTSAEWTALEVFRVCPLKYDVHLVEY